MGEEMKEQILKEFSEKFPWLLDENIQFNPKYPADSPQAEILTEVYKNDVKALKTFISTSLDKALAEQREAIVKEIRGEIEEYCESYREYNSELKLISSDILNLPSLKE